MIDVEHLQRETGWRIVHRPSTPSTNDEAARLRDGGSDPRVAIVADEQTRGRGRGGRSFVSPPGGLYVSLLLRAKAEDLPGALTAAVALAAAEAVESTSGVVCGIKWPNDLWVDGKKLGGILLEAAGAKLPVIAGLGVNLERVPVALEADVRALTTDLEAEAGRPVSRAALLAALLGRIDARVADLEEPPRRAALEDAWRQRLVLLGERIVYVHEERPCCGRLLSADLGSGLLIDDDVEGPVRRRSAHVRDVRPAT